jgi:hypothetical protein
MIHSAGTNGKVREILPQLRQIRILLFTVTVQPCGESSSIVAIKQVRISAVGGTRIAIHSMMQGIILYRLLNGEKLGTQTDTEHEAS